MSIRELIPAHLGLRAEERSRYSVANAIQCLLNQRTHSGSFEAEISSDFSKARPTSTSNSMWVPNWAWGARDLTVGTASAGGYLVGTAVDDSFVPLMRGRSVVVTAGATSLPNLTQNISIPRETTGPTTTSLSTEASTVAESTQTLASIALSPKNAGSYCELSANLLKQAGSRYAENSVLDALAFEVDRLAIAGSGASGEPTGLLNTAGIGSVTGASITEAGCREFETDTGAALSERAAFVATRAVGSLLKGRQRFTGVNETLWTGPLYEGTILGTRSFTSSNVPAGNLIYGADWARLALATWGATAIELSLNPFANFPAGIVGVRALVAFDVAVLTPSSFSLATGVT